jgi:hypothetical protein
MNGGSVTHNNAAAGCGMKVPGPDGILVERDHGQGHNLLRDIKYEPVLGPENNPHYYNQNRVLFELYKERLERNHLSPHPNYGGQG